MDDILDFEFKCIFEGLKVNWGQKVDFVLVYYDDGLCCCWQIFWNESGELLAISTDESYFVLRYSSEAVEKARENPETMTEDGIEDAFDVSHLIIWHKICVFVCLFVTQ